MRHFLLIVFFLLSLPAHAQIDIENPWSRATTPGAKIAAGYMVIRNKSASPDRLIGASSPLAARIETHITVKDGDILRMREAKGYDVPAKGSYELKPGGAHLMFVDIERPFKEGEKIPLTLRFERAGEVRVQLEVRRAAPPSEGHGH